MAELAQQGMEDVLVNVQGFYTACMDWLRISDIDTPEKYFIDPRSPGAAGACRQSKERSTGSGKTRRAHATGHGIGTAPCCA
jgi:hypothetical protein